MPAGRALGGSELLEDGSLVGRLLRHWRRREPVRQLRGVDGRWIASDELEQMTRDRAMRLAASGLVPGERFLLSAGSSADLVITYIAALRAGLVVVPINPAYTEAEVQRIVRAYDSYGRARQQMPLALGDTAVPASGMEAAAASEQAIKPMAKPQ